MASFMKFLDLNVNIIPGTVSASPSKLGLIFGQRITDGMLTVAQNGFTQPNYYVPFLIPSFSNGRSALNYLKNYGIKSEMGIRFTLDLPAPTEVVHQGSMTVVSFSPIPTKFVQLTDFNLSGTATQAAINAQILSATVDISTDTAQLTVYGVPAFNTTTAIQIVGVNNVDYPDPDISDPIALMVWDYYETCLSANASNLGAPAVYLSILRGVDESITPSPDPILLGGLAVYPVVVTVNDDDSVTLTYPSDTLGLGDLPTNQYGDTLVTQEAQSASGTFNGFEVSGANVLINVTDVTGTFTTTSEVSVTWDNSLNGFDFLDNIDLYGAALQFPINTLNDIRVKHKDFYDGINGLNKSDQVLNRHYGTYGIAGNITSLPSNAANLPSPDSNQYILATYPYVTKFGDIPYDNADGNVASGRIAASTLYMLSNGDAPYPALTSATINHWPVSSLTTATTSYSAKRGGTGDIAVGQGWLPFAKNINNVVQFLQSVTTLINEPGTTIPDEEFRYTHIWDCVRWTKREVAELFLNISVLPNNQGTVLISDKFLLQFRMGIIAILYLGQALGMFKNVAAYVKLVTVIADPQNPNLVIASIPEQIIPQLNGGSGTITVFSSLINDFSVINSQQGAV